MRGDRKQDIQDASQGMVHNHATQAEVNRAVEHLAGLAERDSHGKEQHEPGAKLDAGKPRMSLVLGGFPRALWGVAKVGTFGAEKYTDNGWKEVPDAVERYTSALYRHQNKIDRGEYLDSDSGLPHCLHVAWCALAIAELEALIREPEHKTEYTTGATHE